MSTFYKGCWFLQLINAGLSTQFSLACSQRLEVAGEVAGSGECCTMALHSCNEEQKLQETSPSCRKNQLKICIVKAMEDKNISSASQWNLGDVLCNCELHPLVPCLETIYISETPSIPWHGPSQLQRRWELCCACLHTASLSCHKLVWQAKEEKKKPPKPQDYFYLWSCSWATLCLDSWYYYLKLSWNLKYHLFTGEKKVLD